jgi:hypothetical protein
MASAAGIAVAKNLHGFHLGDVRRIVWKGMQEHLAEGCRYGDDPEKTLDVVMDELLQNIKSFLVVKLEDRRIETYCPHRDGVPAVKAA